MLLLSFSLQQNIHQFCTNIREIGDKPRLGRGKYSAKVAEEQALKAYAKHAKQGRKRKLEYQ